MTENSDINDGVGTYDVVLLVEDALSKADAARVHSLHDTIPDQVVYHVLLPVDDEAEKMQLTLGALGSGDPFTALTGAGVAAETAEVAEAIEAEQHVAEDNLTRTLKHLRATHAHAEGRTVTGDVIKALVSQVSAVDTREVIVLTNSHLVSEFFHTDWTSRARRKLDVPVLHLFEHESFNEQGDGPGEGVTGL